MPTEHKIVLPNNVPVSLYPENGELAQMTALANSLDFLQETEVMREVGNFPPFNLLIYDDLMSLGLFMNTGDVHACIKKYSQEGMIDWVDMALSLRRHPIRVVEKTNKKGEMFQRLKPRLDLDWIEYDSNTQVVREKSGVKCPVDRLLAARQTMGRDLYSLCQYDGKIEVVHSRVMDMRRSDMDSGMGFAGIQAEGQGKEFFEGNLDDVAKRLQEEHPDALVVKEPLTYCSHGCSSKPYGCLAVKFEQAYADKNEVFGREHPLTGIDLGLV